MDDFPINTSIYTGFSMAMLNNQMVIILVVRLWIRCIYSLAFSHFVAYKLRFSPPPKVTPNKAWRMKTIGCWGSHLWGLNLHEATFMVQSLVANEICWIQPL